MATTCRHQAFGEQVITEMCQKLLAGGAPGLHFYTLNGPNRAGDLEQPRAVALSSGQLGEIRSWLMNP